MTSTLYLPEARSKTLYEKVSPSASGLIGREFGKTGGLEFPLRPFNKIALRGGKYVDSIYIDGVLYTSPTGNRTETIILSHGEYISQVDVSYGNLIDKLTFKTNRGKVISAGGPGGKKESLSNIRLLAIGGRSGRYLDNIYLEYVQNYIHSAIIAQSVPVITRVIAPGSVYQVVQSASRKIFESAQTTIEWGVKYDYSISATVKMAVELTAKTGIALHYTNTQQMKKEIDEVVSKTETETFSSGENYAIRAAEFDILVDENGYEFMTPISAPSTIILKPGDNPDFLTGFRCLDKNIVGAQLKVKIKAEENKVPVIIGAL